MTAQEWAFGRGRKKLSQVQAAKRLGVSQAYLSQLENGSRVAGAALARKAAVFYRLPTAMPLPEPNEAAAVDPDGLQKDLAALGYPKFSHVFASTPNNPARVVFSTVVQRDLDTRLVEALPWVLSSYVDLNWDWLRDHAKLRNVQNRLGYVVYLAKEVAQSQADGHKVQVLSTWEKELEDARLAREDTLCRESMPQRERSWLRTHRPAAAEHWNLLTSLTPEQLSYAES